MLDNKPIEPMIYINGRPFPYPSVGMELIVATMVDSARNANGEVVGQKIGRDIYKVNSLQWNWLSAETWSMMLKEFDKFYVTAMIPDMVNNSWITIKMYPSDRSAKPYWIGHDGKPTWYTECKVNIIDCGVIE